MRLNLNGCSRWGAIGCSSGQNMGKRCKNRFEIPYGAKYSGVADMHIDNRICDIGVTSAFGQLSKLAVSSAWMDRALDAIMVRMRQSVDIIPSYLAVC